MGALPRAAWNRARSEGESTTDLAVVGAGAAGVMAAIWAARSHPDRRVVVLDGARVLGAKILVAGGGRCNVTHHEVDETAFNGSSPAAIRKVLRRFDVPRTIAFFREIGVELKREETGKLFPVTDRARTVLDALLGAARAAGAELRHPWRVGDVARDGETFVLTSTAGATLRAARVVLATGGRSLPKTGSDGGGYALARALGHTLTPRIFPGLVPLVVPEGHFVSGLSGISVPAVLEVRSGSGKKRAEVSGSLLCTHFGLSGPAALDLSRHLIDARLDDPASSLIVRWLPDHTAETLDLALRALSAGTAGGFLQARLPERLARALCVEAGVDPATPAHRLPRAQRRALARAAAEMTVPVSGDRGFAFAEVTAGGVPLRELHLDTLASRVCPGLSVCGEICDVDGRIGGFNFQWAWASGYVAGTSAFGEDRESAHAGAAGGRSIG
ncbi:MAG TPA: aminoacetone oxidase family FAD-binding enzyme [Longimicrobiales bacterium]|nr:aminoacetone oxidase family FAD-binding enzyme [Longimicrobiales bacterium]